MSTQKAAAKRHAKNIARKKRVYVRPADRGLGPHGGGWNLTQAAEWSGIGAATLRQMAKNGEIPVFKIGRRFLVPREGFMSWFNKQTAGSAA